ncbi:TadG [Photobacterium ganghwense]|uniref:TadG n=1 Tax=Photobacterium ganghwense TaxID=320778 RepID=UPI00359F3380
MNNYKQQQGHAALLFAMMIPALFGIFTLASDGARAIQTKARIEDASEVAALAIAAHNDPNQSTNNSGNASAVNRSIATNIVQAYINDIESITDLKVYKRACEQISDCVKGLEKGESRFFEYEVDVTTAQKSWFPGNDSIAGMGETFSTRGHSLARKYQSEAVDVMFAADFSGSMSNRWSGSAQVKYKELIDIIKEVTVELQKFNELELGNDNTIGISSFNNYTRTIYSNNDSDNFCYLTQMVRDWDGYINTVKTVENIWIPKSKKYCNWNYKKGRFHDISLTSNFDDFNSQIAQFKPDWGTESYQGLIRAAQMLRSGVNSRRLLIVISDGDDNDKPLASALVKRGMCTKIKAGLESDRTEDDRPIKARLAVIGFDYNPHENRALKDCVGEGNVYKAQNRDEILNKILELITEEIGHLK